MKPDFVLFFDSETTGVDVRKARIVELAWILARADGEIILEETRLIKPNGFTIPEEAAKIHGITTEIATAEGEPITKVLEEFFKDMTSAGLLIGHNLIYDINMITAECWRTGISSSQLREKARFCTMINSTDYCRIGKFNDRGGFKFPKLSEAYEIFTGSPLVNCHDALVDTQACQEIFFTGLNKGIFRFNEPHPTILCEVCQ